MIVNLFNIRVFAALGICLATVCASAQGGIHVVPSRGNTQPRQTSQTGVGGMHITPGGSTPSVKPTPANRVPSRGMRRAPNNIPVYPYEPPSDWDDEPLFDCDDEPLFGYDGVGSIPYVSGISTSGGRISGYHVDTVEYDSNPFSTIGGVRRAPRVAPSPPPPVRTVTVQKQVLPQPSLATVQELENTALEEALASGPQGVVHLEFTDAQFVRHATDLVAKFYCLVDGALAPLYTFSIASGVVTLTPNIGVSGELPDKDSIFQAFQSGSSFVVMRDRVLKITCGMCQGAGSVPAFIVRRSDTAVETVERASCTRCNGSGSVSRQVPGLYEVVRKASQR